MSFENDKYSVDKDPYEWCLRQSKRLKAIDPQMNIQMRNHKLLSKMPGELEHEVKFRWNHNCTLDDIANTSQDLRKSTNIGKCTSYKSNHYAKNCPKAKKKVYAIEKDPEDKSPTEESDSDSMGDAIREKSDEEQDPREEFLVEYQEETPLEIQDIQLEANMPQDTARQLVQTHRRCTNIPGYTNQRNCIHTWNSHKNDLARNYLDNHFPNWENQLFPTKANNFNSALGKMTSIGVIIKGINIPYRKSILLATDYQRIYGIDIYNSKNQNINISTNKEKKFSLDIYQTSTQDPLEELLNELIEGQFSTTLTSKQKLSLLKILRKNRPAFAIGEEPLGKIKGHDIKLYLDVEIPYPPMLRRPPYP
ncbi:hypothetical protein O181_060020 [Austropuccinia psidii MF-1]|uniref:Uncharacterized protein n=1 Tax=Austropuccinia psidii MF-1 TaxID=1389203 RepID=A0A9Q3ECK9_9BASI|nr:hypothetical protein [Austropuccinia psidii MF-1]